MREDFYYLSNNSANEFEVLLVLAIDVRIGIRLESVTILRGNEEAIVGIEYLFGENDKPFTSETTTIYTFFTFELDSDSRFQLFWLQLVYYVVGVDEYFLSSDAGSEWCTTMLCFDVIYLKLEEEFFIFKIDDSGDLFENLSNWFCKDWVISVASWISVTVGDLVILSAHNILQFASDH